MEIMGKVHCLFEQSGTFKNEFRKLGYEAYDYDIQNNFGETDRVIDHRHNVGYTCSLACNGRLDISGDTGACVRLCARIYAAEAQKYGTERRQGYGGGKKSH